MRKKLDDLNRKKQEAQEAHMKYLRKKNRHYAAIALLCFIAIMVGIVLIECAREYCKIEYGNLLHLGKEGRELFSDIVCDTDEGVVGIKLILFGVAGLMIDGPLWLGWRRAYGVKSNFGKYWWKFVEWAST